jgi:hypothetical protein
MPETIFYPNSGKPIAYTEDSQHLFTFSGEPVAFMSDDSIYSFSGNSRHQHLGWMIDDWVIDHDGCCVFFTNSATDGPGKPRKQSKPAKKIKQMKPAKGMKEMEPMKPPRKDSWSKFSGKDFFNQ